MNTSLVIKKRLLLSTIVIFLSVLINVLTNIFAFSLPFNSFNRLLRNQLTLRTELPFKISESSGLAYSDGKLWTHNDKGGLACIYNIDTTDGSIKQSVYIDNYANIDWEDITTDKDHIYIGDFGNNYGDRKDLRILVIEKSLITSAPVVHVNARAISFSYSDQHSFSRNNKNNFDCESMISIGDSIYIFTKDRGDYQTRVYRISKKSESCILSPYTNFNVNGRICAASYNAETNQVALLGYMNYANNSFVYLLTNFDGTNFFSGTKKRIEIGNGKLRWKTEGIAFIDHNRLFISCEKTEIEKQALYVFISDTE